MTTVQNKTNKQQQNNNDPTYTGEMIISNDKYRMEEIDVNSYTTRLRLHLKLASTNDEGGYKCCSKNSIGDSEGTISVYDKPIQYK